jgi:hypothetical protein
MASFIYNSFWEDLARGAIDMDTDSFKVMLVTSAYPAVDETAKDSDTKRSAVTNEVTGTGYTAGGAAMTAPTLTKDTANNRLDITVGAASWATATITARRAIIYKVVGGVAANENLVACIDFGSDVTATAGTFSISASTIRIQN